MALKIRPVDLAVDELPRSKVGNGQGFDRQPDEFGAGTHKSVLPVSSTRENC